ncbi:winged helix-turn-helix domain-containing protein [Pseudoalteromonas sp. ZZD1]|uniref:winged helix-turn-helix domain-containing protein n=1 Tax=Pseudoalteromonas sp. ZZD1 TaxID=3139395 RepID=UPI003BAC13E7
MTDFNKAFQLEKLTVDPTIDKLSCDGESIDLQSMAMRILCHLASRTGQLVTRDDLRNHVWGNATVSDHTINNHIYSLRRALAQLEANKKYIHTVTGTNGSGYRLNASIFQSRNKVANSLSNELCNVVGLITKRIYEIKSWHHYRYIYLSVILVLIIALTFYLYMAKPNKYSLVTSMTHNDGRVQSLSVSDDGQILFFSHHLAKHNAWQLYASYTDDLESVSKVFSSSFNNDNFASVSPDKTRVAFVRYNSKFAGIYLANFDSKELRATNAKLHITLPIHNISPSINWLNDEQFFFNMSEVATAPLKLYLYDIFQAKLEQISSPELASQGDLFASISPDKQWLAVMRANNMQSYTINLFNIMDRKFIPTPISLYEERAGFSFSDNSTSLFFVDAEGYLSNYDIATQQVIKITERAYLGYWPTKIIGKPYIVMQQEGRNESFARQIVKYANPLKGGDGVGKVLVRNKMSLHGIAEVGSGRLVFAAVTPSNKVQLWQYDKGNINQLAKFKERSKYYSPLSINWKKGTNKAVLSINHTCQLINIKTGKATPLCPDGENLYTGRFSVSGNEFHFIESIYGNSRVMKMGGSGYPLNIVTAIPNADSIAQSPTGDFFYSRADNNDIYHYNPITKSHTKIISRVLSANKNDVNDFVVFNHGVYFIDKSDTVKSIVSYYNFDTKTIEELIYSNANYFEVALSDDEQHLYLIESYDKKSHLFLMKE